MHNTFMKWFWINEFPEEIKNVNLYHRVFNNSQRNNISLCMWIKETRNSPQIRLRVFGEPD